MSDLISRKALIEEVKKMRIVVRSTDNPFDVIRVQGRMFRKAVDEALAIDAVEVVHGRWQQSDEFAMCSECYDLFKEREVTVFRYCPNCGAKMDGGTDNAFD